MRITIVTQKHKESKWYWKNGTSRLTRPRPVATYLQFKNKKEKMQSSAKLSKVKHASHPMKNNFYDPLMKRGSSREIKWGRQRTDKM